MLVGNFGSKNLSNQKIITIRLIYFVMRYVRRCRKFKWNKNESNLLKPYFWNQLSMSSNMSGKTMKLSKTPTSKILKIVIPRRRKTKKFTSTIIEIILIHWNSFWWISVITFWHLRNVSLKHMELLYKKAEKVIKFVHCHAFLKNVRKIKLSISIFEIFV